MLLPANQPLARFYAGGEQIAAFRGDPPPPPNTPEDWVGSTTTVRGDASTGLTTLPDGRLLREAVADDPEAWLGAAHVSRWGADPKLLVKLLDAGQRLPVHAHPDGEFARVHLAAAHGKAEAWYLLEPGTVYVGLSRDISADELAAVVAQQRTADLLALLNPIELSAGQSVYVAPGTLHAIGQGVLLVEVQEPEDLSILLEQDGFDLVGVDGTLGLGWQTALSALDLEAVDPASLVGPSRDGGECLVEAADEYFHQQLVSGPAQLDAGFAVLVVTGGEGELSGVGADGEPWQQPLHAGQTLLVPAAAGKSQLTGEVHVLACRPPRP
ncbi:class I mannose-6-phosphate isomerase [Aestuariimicrobium ganziense]|uniref:class I mannose-6-phosphate isomerase n=1 Tax=Aestuariimicrobium ganziense TaxID=2773677 RepID=UPI0019454775|nr:class I mannose-6-phosphate isomerase [Aestuariimicrobium ganziense]